MSKTSFEKLVHILRLYLEKQVTQIRKSISTDCQTASFLYYIRDQACYHKKTNAFGISCGLVWLIIRKVSKAIAELLGKDYTKLTETAAEVENLKQKVLEHRGFPQCIGAIDGTHIPMRQPNQNYAD